MDIVRITALLVYAYGALTYGALVALMVRREARRRSGSASESQQPCTAIDFPSAAITVVSFLWFAVLVLLTLVSLNPQIRQWPYLTAGLFLVFMYPPLLIHDAYRSLKRSSALPLRPGWKLVMLAGYLCGPSAAVLCFLGFAEFLPVSFRTVVIGTNAAVAFLFTTAAVYKARVMYRVRSREETSEARSSRRWHLALLATLVLMCGVVMVAYTADFPMRPLLELGLRSIPLAFLFVGTYYEARFEFFDLLIKRGANLMLTVALLTAFFGWALPWLSRFAFGWATPWVYAIALLPLAASLPWLYKSVGGALDNYWLGRRFSAVEAVKHFLSTMRSATDEVQLVKHAEAGLSEIFHAPVSIELGPAGSRPPGFDLGLEAPIGTGPVKSGAVRVGVRANRVPLFSEDAALLASLTDVFAYMLDNMRLQGERRELSLHASRSELKALRAQINPHFLFNALNAIAGLIHRDPLKADRTVEQLAEVFRYTLRGSDTEWTVLEQEMEFVTAYLDVEQARFGPRLRFNVGVDASVRTLKIPTMMVQTLVENAVKHGIAEVREGGTIEVSARAAAGRLVIEVADNGPGFHQDSQPHAGQAGGRGSGRASRFGLRNIRERLAGYYGDSAWLRTRRDEARGLTIVSIEIPDADHAKGGTTGTAA